MNKIRCPRPPRLRPDISSETGEDEHSAQLWEPSPLHSAVYNRDLCAITSILESGENINKLHHGITPLHLAVAQKDTVIAAALIERGSDVLASQLEHKCTPIHRAACGGDVALVRLLLAEGVDINQQIKSGDTPLNIAADHNHMEVMGLLFGRGADVNIPDNNGTTPLSKTALYGYYRAAVSLLAQGAAVDQPDRVGNTPLLHAVRNGQVVVARTLLQAGASVSINNQAGEGPLQIAALHGCNTLVNMLIEAGADVNSGCPVCVATKRQHIPVVQRLAEAGADVDAICTCPENEAIVISSPIFEAIQAKRPNLVLLRTLIRNGCDVNSKIGLSRTPLQIACLQGKGKVVALLLNADCELDLREAFEEIQRSQPEMGALVCRELSGMKPLKRLSRVVIRRALGYGKEYQRKVASLELPAELRHFLMYLGI